MTSVADTVALLTALKKTFEHLQVHASEWDESIVTIVKTLKTLENLSEQYDLCRKADVSDPLCQAFPELQTLLANNLTELMDSDLTLVRNTLTNMQSMNQRLTSLCRNATQVYKNDADSISMESLLEGTSLRPSFAEMLEWAEDVWKYYHKEYVEIKHSIEFLDPKDPLSLSQFRHLCLDHKTKPQIWSILAQVMYLDETT